MSTSFVSAYLNTARIVRTHGKNGEVVVAALDGLPFCLHEGMQAWLTPPDARAPRVRTVLSVREAPAGMLVRFSAAGGLGDAQMLVGKLVLCARADVPEAGQAALVLQAEGRSVYDSRRGFLGHIQEVMDLPAHTVWSVSGGPFGEILIPVIDDVVPEIPLEGPVTVSLLPGLIDPDKDCVPVAAQAQAQATPDCRSQAALRLETLSVFPQMFEPVMSTSILGRAREAGIFDFYAHDLRDWTHDRHRSVDDTLFGGGPGMLMKPGPLFEALDELAPEGSGTTVIFFTPAGEPFTQALAQELSQEQRILFVCGRYEGIDERVYSRASRQISLGDYVLTGGELAAMVVADAIVRLLPGALGDTESATSESFADSGLLEYAQYTRPASFRGMDVPAVLLGGNHAHIALWRRADALLRTCIRRPGLLANADLTEQERGLAELCCERLAAGEDPGSLRDFVFAQLLRKKR